MSTLKKNKLFIYIYYKCPGSYLTYILVQFLDQIPDKNNNIKNQLNFYVSFFSIQFQAKYTCTCVTSTSCGIGMLS